MKVSLLINFGSQKSGIQTGSSEKGLKHNCLNRYHNDSGINTIVQPFYY